MGKLTRKGKHMVKVGNHPRTNIISKPVIVRGGGYKCRILEMHLKLSDQQLKTISHIYRLLHQYLMVTTNQKSRIDMHIKRKSNPNTTLSYHRGEQKRERRKKT